MTFARNGISESLKSNEFGHCTVKHFMNVLYSQISKTRSKNPCPRNLSLKDALQYLLHLFNKELQSISEKEWCVVCSTRDEMYKSDKKKFVGVVERTCGSGNHDLDTPLEIESRDTVIRILQCLQISDWKKATVLLRALKALDSKRFFRFYHEIFMAACNVQTEVHALPMNIWVQQTVATAAVWHKQGIQQVPLRANAIVFCKICGEIKTSHDKALHKNRGKPQPPPTIGSVDVLVDDNQLCLCCTRGTKCSLPLPDQNQQLEDLATTMSELQDEQHQTKYSVSDIVNTHCVQLPLLHVHLLGNILYHAGSSYTVCVQCACVTELDNIRRHQLKCSACADAALSTAINSVTHASHQHRCTLCNSNVNSDSTQHTRVLDPNAVAFVFQQSICFACLKLMKDRGAELMTVFEARQAVLINRCQKEMKHIGFKRKFGH